MKTRNDILAEYVRSRYPEIEKTFDFAAYSAGVALKEFGRCIKEATMFAIQNIKTGKFLYGTDYRYRPPHQRTSKTKMLTYSSIAEAAHDFWVKRKCGKDYRIVVLKSVEVKRVIDYYESKNFI